MSEPDGAPSPARLRSMGFRVALVAVLCAALGGFAAALAAIAAVDRLLSEHADSRLRAATVTLAGELEEDLEDKKPEGVAEVVDDENDEIVTSGIRLAVFAGGARLAGDSWMSAPANGSCETRAVQGVRVRACAGTFQSWTLVAAQPIDERWLHWVYVLAAVGAVLLGATAGAVSSFGLSRWAVSPLQALARALRESRPDAPARLELGEPSGSREVEEIRAALRELAGRLQVLLDQAHRFAADAAHELRTPLTALRAELELLAEESAERDRPAIDRASERVARLAGLVERLLVLALPMDSLSLGFEPVAVADVAQEVVNELTLGERAGVR
ncbi:MAG TPA: HAMP domain-containing sensor histidine kinase, partial [Polyangiaceae bacterium]